MTPDKYHVLLTRFNVRRGKFVDPRVLSPEWLKPRMQLFRQVTYGSVASQSRLPDAWLVFFDEGTPEATRDELRELSSELPLLRVEYCREFDGRLWAERIGRILPPNVDWLLTTRLDNDDAIHRLFVETVQSHARPGVREFINPTHGLIVSNGCLYRKRDYSGHFITLSEPVADFRTVWMDEHRLLARHGRVRQVALPDAWIEVVHGGNLVNQVCGVRIAPGKVSSDAMPPYLSASLIDVRLGELLFENYLVRSRRWVRGVFRRILSLWTERLTGRQSPPRGFGSLS